MKKVKYEPQSQQQKDFFRRNATQFTWTAVLAVLSQSVSAFTEYNIINLLILQYIPNIAEYSTQISDPLWITGAVLAFAGVIWYFTKSGHLVSIFILLCLGIFTLVNCFSTLDFLSTFLVLSLEVTIMILFVYSVQRCKLPNQTSDEKRITYSTYITTCIAISISIMLSIGGWEEAADHSLSNQEIAKSTSTNEEYLEKRALIISDYKETYKDLIETYDPKLEITANKHEAKIEGYKTQLKKWQQKETRKKKYTSRISDVKTKIANQKAKKQEELSPIQNRKSSKINAAQMKRDSKLEKLASKYDEKGDNIESTFASKLTGTKSTGQIIIILCLIINICCQYNKTIILWESGLIEVPLLSSYDLRDSILNETIEVSKEAINQNAYGWVDKFHASIKDPSIPWLPALQVEEDKELPKTKIKRELEEEEIYVGKRGERLQYFKIETDAKPTQKTDAKEEEEEIFFDSETDAESDAKNAELEDATAFQPDFASKKNRRKKPTQKPDANENTSLEDYNEDTPIMYLKDAISNRIRQAQSNKGALLNRCKTARAKENRREWIRHYLDEVYFLKGLNPALKNFKNSQITALKQAHNLGLSKNQKI